MTLEQNIVRLFALPPRGQPAVPAEMPGEMPAQDFWRWNKSKARVIPSAEQSTAWRRILVFAGTLGLIGWAVWQMYLVLSVGGMTPLEWGVLVLFSINFAWIALSFVSSTVGFIALVVERWPRRAVITAPAPLARRTAVIIPVYNEDPVRIFATIEASVCELREAHEAASFDFFILSDTTQAEKALAEEAAFLRLRERVGDFGSVFYRRRKHNEHRKTGNIADFCSRWGSAYDFMLVLDADSTMSSATMIELARRMEADERLGLLQTIPLIINADTLFARIQQFAARAYGSLMGAGLAWWTQNEGNYWGHNAIIRTGAFMSAAGLSELSGRPPFGGSVLSHDFVEAALLRRAGWKVRTAMDLNGSYEECPPSLLDLAIRDRRWCQGNLQHSRLVNARGLHWVSRMHFISGIMSYLASPFWLMLILCGLALSLQAQLLRPEYFPDYFSDIPQWPIIDPERALGLFYFTMAVLLTPKLYGYLLLIFDKKWRNEAGGVFHGAVSVVCEVLLSALLAPIMMLIQTGAVWAVLRGHDTGWKPQRRDGGDIAMSAVIKRHARHVIFGALLTVAAFLVSPALAAWLSPALIGLLFSIVLSGGTASHAAGKKARMLGLFLTPEEVAPPKIAERAASLKPAYAEAVASASNFEALAADGNARGAHLALIESEQHAPKARFDAPEIIAAAKIADVSTVKEALALLTPTERQALANSRKLIIALAGKDN